MADDVTFQSASPATPPSGTVVAAHDVGGVLYQEVELYLNAGASNTPVPGDGTNGIDVDVTRIAAGGSVDIGATTDAEATGNGSVIGLLKRLRTLLAGGLPAALVGGRLDVNVGATGVTQPVSDGGGSLTVDGTVTVQDGGGSLTVDGTVAVSSIAAGDNNIGNVDVVTLPALPAGSNNIGDVDVLTLPSIPAGTNNIGDVDVLTVPIDPFGANADAAVAAGAAGSIQAKLRRVTQGLEDLKSLIVLAAGDNNIGNVDVVTLPALPAGTNNIGDVDVLTLPTLPAGNNNIGDVDVASVVPGVDATSLGKAEDAAHTTGDTGVLALAVRKDAGGSFVSADGDYTPFSVDANGFLRVVHEFNVPVAGAAAHDAAVAGNPVRVGATASTASQAAVSADGDAVDLWADRSGRLVTRPNAPADRLVSGVTTFTTTAAADVIAAQGAGVRVLVTAILVTNAHATVGTKVSIRAGTTVKYTGFAAAAGGGFALASETGLFVTAANEAVTAVCGTTGADVDVSVTGVQTP